MCVTREKVSALISTYPNMCRNLLYRNTLAPIFTMADDTLTWYADISVRCKNVFAVPRA